MRVQGRILRLMDDPKIKLYQESGEPDAWKWEILLGGKKVASGTASGSQEYAYAAARAALLKYRIEN